MVSEKEHPERSESYSPVFDSQVLPEGIVCGEGSGYSKKESHQLAAKVAYKRIRSNKELAEQVFAAKEERKNPPSPVQEESAEDISAAIEPNETPTTNVTADTNYFSEAEIISIPPMATTIHLEVQEEELYSKEDDVLTEVPQHFTKEYWLNPPTRQYIFPFVVYTINGTGNRIFSPVNHSKLWNRSNSLYLSF